MKVSKLLEILRDLPPDAEVTLAGQKDFDVITRPRTDPRQLRLPFDEPTAEEIDPCQLRSPYREPPKDSIGE